MGRDYCTGKPSLKDRMNPSVPETVLPFKLLFPFSQHADILMFLIYVPSSLSPLALQDSSYFADLCSWGLRITVSFYVRDMDPDCAKLESHKTMLGKISVPH